MIKEEVTLSTEVLEKVEPLLEESKRVVHNKLLERLPPMSIQYHIDLIFRVSLPNLPHYQMNSKESKILNKMINELIQKGHIK